MRSLTAALADFESSQSSNDSTAVAIAIPNTRVLSHTIRRPTRSSCSRWRSSRLERDQVEAARALDSNPKRGVMTERSWRGVRGVLLSYRVLSGEDACALCRKGTKALPEGRS